MRLSRRQRVKNQRRYLGLKRNTYLNVLALLALELIIVIIGSNFKNQENLTAKYYNQTHAYAKEIKKLTTYKRPTIDLKGKDRAVYIIQKVWRKDWKTGVALASCESGYREKVVNSIGATGYFQINTPVHNVPIEEMQNGWSNAGFALALFQEQGFTPWVSSKECWEKRI